MNPSGGRRLELGEALKFLHRGRLELVGRLPWASNATFLAKVVGDLPPEPLPMADAPPAGPSELLVVYKPRAGERPLWDFPGGTLCQREVAAFEVSEALGWSLVPPTLLRDGPFGVGMVQLFVDHDPEEHFFTLRETHGAFFRRLAIFDVVTNNADRKGGHCLRGLDGRLWAIDHGVSFHCEDKLRTVIWDYAGEGLPEGASAALALLEERLGGKLGKRLARLLSRAEVAATAERTTFLRQVGSLPREAPGNPYPWPLV
ncbi:MAG: SCO1664 family protein [Acidimicrobiia bacterium]